MPSGPPRPAAGRSVPPGGALHRTGVGGGSRRPGLQESRSSLKILLIRLSAMGDVVRTLPALTCVRRAYPEAHIAWAVEEAASDILRDQPGLDETVVLPRRRLARALLHLDEAPGALRAAGAALRALRESRFDLVLDFQGTIKTGLLARLTGAPRLVGFGRGHAREMSWIFYNERVTPQRRRLGRVERALALVSHLGASVDGAAADIPERVEDAAFVARFLAALGAGTGPESGPVVVFPGTSRAQAYKRYPPARFAQAADLVSERTGAPIVVAWGPGEQEIAEEVGTAMRAPAAVAPPMTLGQLVSLIRRARVFIAGDTGPMHIAWTVGTPVVAIYGPTDPVLNQPGGDFSAVAYRKVFCSPCRNRGCIARTCLERLDPAAVADAALSVIARARASLGPVAGLEPTRALERASVPPRFGVMGPGSSPPLH